jgi:hypothetical protein
MSEPGDDATGLSVQGLSGAFADLGPLGREVSLAAGSLL